MTIPEFITKAIEGGWMNDAVRQAIVLFGGDGFGVFVNGFGWVILHDKNEEPNGGLFQLKADSFRKEQVFLDPLAWQAVGKVEGWDRLFCMSSFGTNGEIDTDNAGSYDYDGISADDHSLPVEPTPEWLFRMHRMIDALAEGKTIEQYLENL